MKKKPVDYSDEHKRSMQLAMKMQEALPDNAEAHIVGMAAQKIGCICAVQLGMQLETYLKACTYCFLGTQAEMERQKNESRN